MVARTLTSSLILRSLVTQVWIGRLPLELRDAAVFDSDGVIDDFPISTEEAKDLRLQVHG